MRAVGSQPFWLLGRPEDGVRTRPADPSRREGRLVRRSRPPPGMSRVEPGRVLGQRPDRRPVIDTGERKIVLKGGADARYLSTGHFVYVRQGTLFAVEFNAPLTSSSLEVPSL